MLQAPLFNQMYQNVVIRQNNLSTRSEFKITELQTDCKASLTVEFIEYIKYNPTARNTIKVPITACSDSQVCNFYSYGKANNEKFQTRPL